MELLHGPWFETNATKGLNKVGFLPYPVQWKTETEPVTKAWWFWQGEMMSKVHNNSFKQYVIPLSRSFAFE
jgi:hypothetical protein